MPLSNYTQLNCKRRKKTCISLNLLFNVLTLVDMQLFVVIKSFFFFKMSFQPIKKDSCLMCSIASHVKVCFDPVCVQYQTCREQYGDETGICTFLFITSSSSIIL